MNVSNKLLLPPQATVGFLGLPSGLADAILDGRMQADTSVADAVIVFVRSAIDLTQTIPLISESTERYAVTWIGYPKAGQLNTDLNRDVIRETLADISVRTVRQIAIDEVWSALQVRD